MSIRNPGLARTALDPIGQFQVYDDFNGRSAFDPVFLYFDSLLRWDIEVLGGSLTCQNVASIAGHPGRLQYSMRCAMGGGDYGLLYLQNCTYGTNAIVFKTNLRFDTIGAAGRRFWFGNGENFNTVGGLQPNSWFGFTANGAGNWIATARNGGATTSVDTGIAPDTNYHAFAIYSNDDGTLIAYYIDGVAVAQLATNLPTAQNGAIFFQYYDAVGLGAQELYIDYIYSLMNGLNR